MFIATYPETPREVRRGPGQGQQLEPVALPDAVGLLEADVRRLAPLPREPAERLRADPPARRQVDDGLQHHGRTAGQQHGLQPLEDVGLPYPLADARFDDDRRGLREHVHQRLVAAAQVLVGGEAGGTERAVQRPVGQRHRHRDVAADPRQPGGGELHRVREPAHVGDDRRQFLVEDRLADRRGLPLRGALGEQQRDRRLDDLQVLRLAVHPRQERDAEPQALPGGEEQVRDLLVRLAAAALSHGAILTAR
jgi:hypothetical protein